MKDWRKLFAISANSKHQSHHEEGITGERQDCQGCTIDCTGVRFGVHFVHHELGLRKVQKRKTKDYQW
jgi:uncharacterized metal-binding protein